MMSTAEYNLQLLHVNDIHSRFDQINHRGEKCTSKTSGNYHIFSYKTLTSNNTRVLRLPAHLSTYCDLWPKCTMTFP